jgi:hypothetical protein
MEVHLDRRISEKRVYPSININRSGTRRESYLKDGGGSLTSRSDEDSPASLPKRDRVSPGPPFPRRAVYFCDRP